MFAKWTKFGKDLYADLVAPSLGVPLLVESWPNGPGKMPSRCSGPFIVENVDEMDFAEVEDDDREDEHGQRPDRGYGSGEGPLLGAGLARPEPVPGEVKKNRLEALDRRTARQVGKIYLNVYMWNAQRKYDPIYNG